MLDNGGFAIPAQQRSNVLKAHLMGINTHQELVVYMREDCPLCRSEGFDATGRVSVQGPHHRIIAKLNIVDEDNLPAGHLGLSNAAWVKLKVLPNAELLISHAPLVESMSALRAKIYEHSFTSSGLRDIIDDIACGHYSDIEIASFITACGGDRLNLDEIIALTDAMVKVGDRITWPSPLVVDKHCVGGLPGNRTTPIVTAIVSANGLVMPKTSSRAITSPAGTADCMETMTTVALTLAEIRRVVEKTGACLAWGGSVNLSPVDDVLIRIEKALDLDSEGQLIASVLSKKIAAGSSHVLIDIPVGPTAKIRTETNAAMLAERLRIVGEALGIAVSTHISDGRQPVGRGIGPALEARDVLAVLRNAPNAPADLRHRALALSAHLLALGGKADAAQLASDTLTSGRAWQQFLAICTAQGGFHTPDHAPHTRELTAPAAGQITAVDNRRLARLAKLAGAPDAKTAGVAMHVRIGDKVAEGAPLLTLHAESPGELDYAYQYYLANPRIIDIGEPT